jgi:glycosyltransferase involved in cell wall biosynthesis
LIRGAGLLFAHADKLADDLRRRYSPRAPVVVVPHGAGPARRSPLPARPSLLFFGRMSFYKGLDVLLDAMPLIWRAKPDVTLTVAGEGELPAHPVLADQRIEVEARHVPEAEIPALFAAASCVVLPYREASQSGVGSLAKQYGRAVVASSVGGLPQLVGPGHGRLVPPDDVHALAQAVVELLGDPVLLEEMGAAAAAALDNGTGWRQVAEATVDAYERLLPPLTTSSKSRA